MSMLSGILSQVMANARAKKSGGGSTKEDPTTKANRDNWFKVMNTLTEKGTPEQVAAWAGHAPEGVDVSGYTNLSGIKTPEQNFNNTLNNTMNTLISGITGKPPTQPATVQTPQTTDTIGGTEFNLTVPETTTTPATTSPDQKTSIASQFTNDFLIRSAIKKFSNIDVGAHYFEAPKWFAELNTLTDSGIPLSTAITDLSAKYGFIPDGASNLKELSIPERTAIFEREFSSALNDPTLNSVFAKSVPPGTNIEKTKIGAVLEAFASQGRFIPPHYQPYLDRYRGLEDPTFVSDEIKTQIFQTSGKNISEITPEDVTNAKETLQLNNIISMSQEAAARVTGSTKAQWEMEKMKPIPGDLRTKYGIGSKYKTFEDLADAGLRFPTESENTEYRDMTDLVDIMDNKLVPLINKIFTASDDYGSRLAHGGHIQAAMAMGDELGITAQQYTRQLAIFSKKMLSMVERGGRFTDQDYQKILETLPKVNFALPDGKILAGRLIEDARVLLGQKLELFENIITKPIGQPGGDIPSKADDITNISDSAKALIEKYGGKK